MAVYRDNGVFNLSITWKKNFQYRPLLTLTYISVCTLEYGIV